MSSPTVILLDAWPQPSTSAEAIIFATETQLFLRYQTNNREIAVIHFPLVKILKFGSPNDEALGGHPLTKVGLRSYQVSRVDHSPWVAELERQNAVHPRHDRAQFLENTVHYIFTFQDSTLECVVNEGKFWVPQRQVFVSEEEAKVVWFELIRDKS